METAPDSTSHLSRDPSRDNRLVNRRQPGELPEETAAFANVITYRSDKDIELDAFIDVYRRSTLGERRPVHDRAIMAAMLEHGDILISAWDRTRLVGLARTLTDYAYVAYLADLAVDLAYQRQGIGKELVHRTRAALKGTCFITLLAAPKANDYYPRLGFSHNPRAWVLTPAQDPYSSGQLPST